MHLRPAKYIDEPLETSDSVRVGFGVGPGSTVDTSISKLTMPNTILADGNISTTQQFTVNSTNYTKTATNTTTLSHQHVAPSNRINTKLGNKDSDSKNHNSCRHYANYPDSYSYCFDGSKRFLTLEYSPANNSSYINSKVAPTSTSFIKLDKTKQMELSIINLVELSAFAAEECKFELALDQAKEALKCFNSLNVFMMQQKQLAQHSNSSFNSNSSSNNYRNVDKVQPPLTTGVRLLELAIMVNSNLACQLQNNAHFEDSLELYTQLCKMATGNPSAISTLAASNPSSSQPSSQQQYDAKFFLYRFGINIGNVLYDMNEYQRSLKYYRLTLDRLSSCGQENLKIKLMNNISITILTLRGKSDMDAITSLNLLLADNFPKQQPQQTGGNQIDHAHQHQQQQPLITNKIGLEVCNSNHHKFGLYLIVCHYQRADLTSMMNTLRGLVKVDICRHYIRVFELDDGNVDFSKEGRTNSNSSTSLSAVTDTGSSSHVNSAHSLQLQQQQIATHNRYQPLMAKINRGRDYNRAETIVRQQEIISSMLGAIFGKESNDIDGRDQPSPRTGMTSFGDPSATPATTDSTIRSEYKATQPNPLTFVKPPLLVSTASLLTKLSVFEKVRQVMSCIQQDRLEMLIREKHNQISGSLIMACNLLLSFDDLATTRKIRKSGGNDIETSVFEFCMKLLDSNKTYKSLVCDLKTNNISDMLNKKKHKLNEAIDSLKDVEKSQTNTKPSNYHRSVSAAIDLQTESENKSVTLRTGSIKERHDNSNVILKSSILATNSSLLYLLQNKPKKALESAELALKLDISNIDAYINLANSYYYLNNLTLAELLYQQASRLINHSTSWVANYNLALVGRKLGHHFDKMRSFIRLVLSHDKSDFNSLMSQTMTIPKVQMAMM